MVIYGISEIKEKTNGRNKRSFKKPNQKRRYCPHNNKTSISFWNVST